MRQKLKGKRELFQGLDNSWNGMIAVLLTHRRNGYFDSIRRTYTLKLIFERDHNGDAQDERRY